jgi:hypothetical protein
MKKGTKKDCLQQVVEEFKSAHTLLSTNVQTAAPARSVVLASQEDSGSKECLDAAKKPRVYSAVHDSVKKRFGFEITQSENLFKITTTRQKYEQAQF